MESSQINNSPIVLVHGMFGFGPGELGDITYWGSALDSPSPLPRIEASVGPISSPHDRACELAAQLKGERVDYGEIHALAQGHDRFGKDYRGRALWPKWNERHPLHMVGHSLGAATVRALQALLERDYWGWGSSAHWIASVTSIAGPLNGSTVVYYFGADVDTGLLRRGVGVTPVLHVLELYTAFGGRLLDNIYDFDLDHWGYSRQAGESLTDYIQRIRQSQFFWGPDNAFYSTSLQGAMRDNANWPTYPGTYYLSIVSKSSFCFRPRGYHYPSPTTHPKLHPTSWYIGRKQFDRPPIPTNSFRSADWWENDGLVPTFSQQFPHLSGRHPLGGTITIKTGAEQLLPGRWYTQWEHGFDHASILKATRFWQMERGKALYRSLFMRLAALKIPSFQ